MLWNVIEMEFHDTLANRDYRDYVLLLWISMVWISMVWISMVWISRLWIFICGFYDDVGCQISNG
jgi:hypothetical protein